MSERYENVWAAAFAWSFHNWIKTMPNTPVNRLTCAKLAFGAAEDAVKALKELERERTTESVHKEAADGEERG